MAVFELHSHFMKLVAIFGLSIESLLSGIVGGMTVRNFYFICFF